MAEPHVALGESWQVHLSGESARFFFPPPRSRCTYMVEHSQELGNSTACQIIIKEEGWQRGVGGCTYMVKPPGVCTEILIMVGKGPGRCT